MIREWWQNILDLFRIFGFVAGFAAIIFVFAFEGAGGATR